MKTNLIQAYINNPETQKYNSGMLEKNFDVNKELATRTFIKPLPGSGYLVKNNLFDIPSEWFKDAKYTADAFVHSVKGEANDHELGKLNDLGMKLGGLAIASYLFTRRQTPLAKAMEFVGLTTFFASMNIWPKLALQLPAYLIHGVNIRQKYVDNYGRKKMFYQDHQFIPWDLYSDEEINRIGDRMNVPKDMKNRRDFIQEKMRKIALQNNTMWMLTAGFATPIMSALLCNALEGPISRHQKYYYNKKANKLLSNFSDEALKISKSAHFAKVGEDFSNLLSAYKDSEITPELFQKIVKSMTTDLDPVTSAAVKKDLMNILPNDSYVVDRDVLSGVQKAIKSNFAKMALPEDVLNRLIPSVEAIEAALTEKGLLTENVKDFSEYVKLINSLIEKNISDYIAENGSNDLSKKLNLFRKKLLHSGSSQNDSMLVDSLKSKPSTKLSESVIGELKSIMKSLSNLRARLFVLDKYGYIKFAQAPETVLADVWNEIASPKLLETLDITPQEIKNVRHDRTLVAKLLRNKFDVIVSDDKKYTQVVSELENALSALPSQHVFENISSVTSTEGENAVLYKDNVVGTFNDAANSLRNSKMRKTAEALNGYGDDGVTALKYIYLKFPHDRIIGVKSSFYRLLNTLDMYRRVATLKNVDRVLSDSVPREVKEEIVELCKNILISGHSSDYAVKFYSKRNPERNSATKDFSQIESRDNKIIYKYLDSRQSGKLVEMPNDRAFYEAVMKLMYDGEIHPETSANITDASLKQDFMRYREVLLKYLGGDQYFAKPNHLVNGARHDSSSLLRMLLLGSAPDEMFHKLFRQQFNSSKWLKIFGLSGASLLGVTVLSQFFMGRMPKPKKEVK